MVPRDGQTYIHRIYHLTDDEQQQFAEFYYLPSITIVNEQEQYHPLLSIILHSERLLQNNNNTSSDGSNVATNTNTISSPSNSNNNPSSSNQEPTPIIWVMWRYRCDSTLKENFELACFPFDQQRLSMDLRIDDDDAPFNLYIHDVRLQKLAVDNTEYMVLEPETKHFHSKSCQVQLTNIYAISTHPLICINTPFDLYQHRRLNAPDIIFSTHSFHLVILSSAISRFASLSHVLCDPYRHHGCSYFFLRFVHTHAHPISTPYRYTLLSTHPINLPYQHTLSTHPHVPHTTPLLTLQHLVLAQVSSHSVLICKIPLPEPPSTSSFSSFSSHSKDLSKTNYLLSPIPHGWIIVYKHIFSR